MTSYTPVICNHCHPTNGEGWGIDGLKCGAITFQVYPQCRGNDRVLTLGSLPREIFYCKVRGKEQSFDLQFASGGGAHSRALKAEKF